MTSVLDAIATEARATALATCSAATHGNSARSDGSDSCTMVKAVKDAVCMTVPVARAAPVGLLRHLRRARDHIDGQYVQDLDLDELARVAGVSKFHLVRCFRSTYGETPMRYLTRRRVERAQDLLRAANLTVTEVCAAVGFASLGSFSARFAQLVGESPTTYRNRWAASGGPHVPGCYLFMCGVLDPGGTTGRLAPNN